MSCSTLRVLLLKATKRDGRYYYSRNNTSSLLDDDNILKWGVRNESMKDDHGVQVDLHVLMSDTIYVVRYIIHHFYMLCLMVMSRM